MPVTWRGDESSVTRVDEGATGGRDASTTTDRDAASWGTAYRGAEAVVRITEAPADGAGVDGDETAVAGGNNGVTGRLVDDFVDGPLVVKQRVTKSYRHPSLDQTLRRDRTVIEARLTSEARRLGVATPLVYDVDVPESTITFQYVGSRDLAVALDGDRSAGARAHVEAVGRYLGRLHDAGIVHGDPTTRNVRVDRARERDGRVSSDDAHDETATRDPFLIDFGLGYYSGHVEDHAMDLHVFEGSLEGTVSDPDPLVSAFEAGYVETGDEGVLDRLGSVCSRGRYR